MEENTKVKDNKRLLIGVGVVALAVVSGVVIINMKSDEVDNPTGEYVEDEHGNTGNITYIPGDAPTKPIDTTYTEVEELFQEVNISEVDHFKFAEEQLGEEYKIIDYLKNNSEIIKNIVNNKKVSFSQEKLATRYDAVHVTNNVVKCYQMDNTGQYINLDIRFEYPADSDVPYYMAIRLNNRVDGDIDNLYAISDIGYALGMALGDETLANTLAANMNTEFTYRNKKYSVGVFTEKYDNGNYINFIIADESHNRESTVDTILNSINNQTLFNNSVMLSTFKHDLDSNILSKINTKVESIEKVRVTSDASMEEVVIDVITADDKLVKLYRYTDKIKGTHKYGLDLGFKANKNMNYTEIASELAKIVLGVDVDAESLKTDSVYKAYMEGNGASIYCLDERLVIASLHSKYVYNYSELYNAFGYDDTESEMFEVLDYEEFYGEPIDTSPVEGFEHGEMED